MQIPCIAFYKYRILSKSMVCVGLYSELACRQPTGRKLDICDWLLRTWACPPVLSDHATCPMPASQDSHSRNSSLSQEALPPHHITLLPPLITEVGALLKSSPTVHTHALLFCYQFVFSVFSVLYKTTPIWTQFLVCHFKAQIATCNSIQFM